MFLRDLEVFFLGTAMSILLCSVLRSNRHPCLSGYFKILQCAEFKINRFAWTGTGVRIQVCPAIGTQAFTPFITQRLEGYVHGHLFFDFMGKVYFITAVCGCNEVI